MYYEYFGLTQAPFRITPNTDFFFVGGNRGPILEALIYAVTNGEGIIKVSGEVGSGKTMLCNMLMARLPDNVETVYLANPSVSPDEILHAIAFELQLGTDRQATRLEMMQALQDYLLKRHAEGKRVVVFVEESQGMPLATLEEIRLLSNLETRNDKLLQIVLFGQPELDENLRQPNIRQLRERITHSFSLSPLTASDVREYLMFRMRAAGYHGPDLFGDNIIRTITRASGGLTRRINLIADKALLSAFSENTHTLKPRHIEAALRDSEFHHGAARAARSFQYGWVIAALAGGALGAAGFAWFTQHITPPPAAAPAANNSTLPQSAAVQPVSSTATTNLRSLLPAADSRSLPDAISSGPAPAPAAANSTEALLTVVKPGLEKAAEAGIAKPSIAATPSVTVERSGMSHTVDILERRLAATAVWMAQQPDSRWTLQTLSTTSEEDLRSHLRFLSKSVEINRIFVYRYANNVDQIPVLSVLYGTYDNRADAERAMGGLPAQLKANRPLLVNVQSIRERIR